jgi:alkylation response protein AidB-like acyl-CoA dehydrogenase
VEIPAENLVGTENNGWAVAQSTLTSERGLPIVELTERMRRYYPKLVDLARKAGKLNDVQVRRQLTDIYADIETCNLFVNSMLAKVVAGEHATEEPSYIKIHYSELLRRFTDLGVRLQGLESQYDHPYLMGGGYETGNWMFDFMNSYAWTIAGGSNEVIRNIIAERILGLPR